MPTAFKKTYFLVSTRTKTSKLITCYTISMDTLFWKHVREEPKFATWTALSSKLLPAYPNSFLIIAIEVFGSDPGLIAPKFDKQYIGLIDRQHIPSLG